LSQLTEEAERLDKERQRAESQAEADRLTISRLKGEVEDAKNKALVEEKEKNRLGLLYNEHCQQLEAQQNLITQLNTQVLTLQEQIKSNEVLIKSYKRKREQELQSPEVAETIKRATNILTAIRGTPTK
jgi:chromosome segregation ATPase